HGDTPALELLNVILGQGESSRLNVSVVRRDKAAVAAGTFINPLSPRRGPGTLTIFGIVNQGVEVLRLDTLIVAQLDSVRRQGVTADELTKAKNTFRASVIRSRETTLDKAEALHHYRMFHASLEEINTDLERYLAVTADDVRRVATTYLEPANAVVLILKPAPAGETGGAP
ncbi:MAG: M16 family metallopeptidase, partial [Gemmatimonadales bacterium]